MLHTGSPAAHPAEALLEPPETLPTEIRSLDGLSALRMTSEEGNELEHQKMLGQWQNMVSMSS